MFALVNLLVASDLRVRRPADSVLMTRQHSHPAGASSKRGGCRARRIARAIRRYRSDHWGRDRDTGCRAGQCRPTLYAVRTGSGQIDERLTPPNGDYILGLTSSAGDVYSRIILWCAGLTVRGHRLRHRHCVAGRRAARRPGGYFRGWTTRCARVWWTSCSRSPRCCWQITIVACLPSLTNTESRLGSSTRDVRADRARIHIGACRTSTTSWLRDHRRGSQRIIVRHVLPNIDRDAHCPDHVGAVDRDSDRGDAQFWALGTQPPMPSWGPCSALAALYGARTVGGDYPGVAI